MEGEVRALGEGNANGETFTVRMLGARGAVAETHFEMRMALWGAARISSKRFSTS